MSQEALACPLTKGEKVLVALDGSIYSEYAIDQAISLGDKCNSTIYLISVIDLHPEQMAVAAELTEKLSSEARQLLDAGKEKVEKANLACETIVRMGGHVHDIIVQEAKERDIDLIAIASHGRSGLSRVFYGSVAAGMLHRVDRPLLLIRSA